MKINQELPIHLEKVAKEQKNTGAGSLQFSGMVAKQDQKLQQNALNKLLSDIEGAGERLVRSRTFRDLAKYKSLVKQFVKEAVDYGMNLNQSQSWNQYDQSRPLQTVKMIDEKLIRLTEDVMDKENDGIAILGQIGEIKGLLINLYT